MSTRAGTEGRNIAKAVLDKRAYKDELIQLIQEKSRQPWDLLEEWSIQSLFVDRRCKTASVPREHAHFPDTPPSNESLVSSELREQWRMDTGGSAEADRVLDALVTRYLEPHRHYHAPTHIFAVLSHAEHLMANEHLDKSSDGARAIRFALWFHDAIYDVASTTNEHDSAILADSELEALEIDERLRSDVHRLIMITKHPAVPRAIDEAIVHDVDLSILGSPADIYDTYVTQVRAEYAHVSEADWRVGRASILTSFLDSDRIFHTETGVAREPVARRNLTRERDTLR